jgi:Uma2 family endonuclease
MAVRLSGAFTMTRAHLRFSPRAEHTMGMPAVVRHRWTAQEVRNLQDESRAWPRYELIGGELYVTPAPGVFHQRAVAQVFARLFSYVTGGTTAFAEVLASPADIELEEESILQPDVFVFPRLDPAIEKPAWKDITSLWLAVEVISPSSARADRVEKRDQYMRTAVDEYWVVDLDGRRIERWFKGRPNVEIARETLEWRLRDAPDTLTIDLPRLFADIGLPRRL